LGGEGKEIEPLPGRVRSREGGAAPPGSVEDRGTLAGAIRASESTPDFDLLRRHTLSDEPRSLRRLGAELGVSGEWVRRREQRAREAICAELHTEGSPLQLAVHRLVDRLGPVAWVEELDAAIAELDPDRLVPAAPHRRALLLFLMGYEISGGFVQPAGLEARALEALRGLTESGPVDLDRWDPALAGLGIRAGLRHVWLDSRSGFHVLGGRLARDTQVLEVSIAILREAEVPLDLEQLFARTGPPMSFESFRSRVQQDDRFRRQGVRRYGLSEWGAEPYTTLVEKMSEEIERNGGAMALDALVGAMGERFEATEGSVRYRAGMPQFEVDSAGRISRCISPLIVPPKPLALSHGCFHLEAGWAVRLKVTPSLLHGTTTRVPLAFARALGLQLGISREFASPFGTLTASWHRHSASAAQLSSLRSVVRGLEASEDDRLFVIHAGKDRLDFKLIPGERCDAVAGIEHLVLECGCEPSEEPMRKVLAGLGLDPNLPDPEAAIRTRLGERREGPMAAWLDP
jgi:hypothetical protein